MKRWVVLAGLLCGAGLLLAQQGQVQVGNFGPDSALTLTLNGAITSTFTADLFPATTRPLTVVGAELNLGTGAVGCSTFPVINVWDSTSASSIANVTLVASTTQYVMTINSASVPPGHVIAARISTAPVGCSTSPATAIINVLYH